MMRGVKICPEHALFFEDVGGTIHRLAIHFPDDLSSYCRRNKRGELRASYYSSRPTEIIIVSDEFGSFPPAPFVPFFEYGGHGLVMDFFSG